MGDGHAVALFCPLSGSIDCLDYLRWRLDNGRSGIRGWEVCCFGFEQHMTAKSATPDDASHDLCVRSGRNVDIAAELGPSFGDLLLKLGNDCRGALGRHPVVLRLQTLHQ